MVTHKNGKRRILWKGSKQVARDDCIMIFENKDTNMETQATSHRVLETALIENCWKNPKFKKPVVSDPKGMLERHTGQKLPPEVKIFIHEEDANTLHFSIAPTAARVAELSDEDLSKVAGGTYVTVNLVPRNTMAGTVVTGAPMNPDGGW